MARPFNVWIMLVALSLQGSMVAHAAIVSSMPSDCQTSAGTAFNVSHKSCCPGGSHAMSCCPDICVGVLAILSTAPASPSWHGHSVPIPQWRTTSFASRDDSPLIRPPIL
jgi:hypothetical protein